MKLFFRKTGEGKPLIILHGLFGMSDNWMTLSKQFAENGFACYAVDQRNHGRSPHSDEFSFKSMADDLLELMTEEQLISANIIGHSMGGKTAMYFASMHPEKTEKLVVSDIAPKKYEPHHNHELNAIQSVDLNTIHSRKEAEVLLRTSLHVESTVQFLLKNLYWKVDANEGPVNSADDSEEKLAWRFNLDAIAKHPNAVGEALPANFHFDKPTLFLRGEKSGYISDLDIPGIKKHFPKAEIKTISNSGHWIHADNPKEFMEVTLHFLQS